MRKLLLLVLVSFSLLAKSQVPAGLPSPNSTGFAKYGYLKTDSAGIAALRDTSFNPKYAGTWVYWQNAGVDSSFWVFNGASSGRRWGKVVMITSTGTGYVMYSDTSAMLSPYLRKYDTTAMLSKYLRTYDTTAMLAGYIRNTKIGVTVQPYDANTTILGNSTTGTGSIVRQGSPSLTLPSIAAITVSGGIAALPTGSGTLAYTRDTGRTVSAFATGGSLNKVRDSLTALISAGGFGTVLSVATTDGVGIVSSVATPTSTPNISIRVDTGRATAQIVSGGTLKKVTDSLGLVVSTADALKLNISDTAAMLTPNYRRTITKITNSDLVNSTISGTALGSNLPALSFGTYLQQSATSYNGTTANTISTNATSSNTGSTLVARDINGDFAARNITGSLSGNASSASTVTVTNDNTTNATMYPLWSSASSGNNSPKTSSSKITFNPSTGVLSSSFSGSLSGNATTASTLQTARTINGVPFDGSANISISASVDSSLSAGYGITGSPFNGSLGRTWVVDTTKIIPYTDTLASWGVATKAFVRSFGYGTGSVTSVATNTGSGITGGTITTTGTLAIDTVIIATRPRVQKGIDSVAALIPNVSGYKLISDTLFNGGYTTRNTTKKIADSLGVVISTGLATKVNISDTASMLTNYRTGIIALNADTATLPARFTNQTNLANSKVAISDTATMLSGYKTYYPRAALSAGTGISYNQSTGVITNTSPSSGGTVTSIATDATMQGGTITTSGTLKVDTVVMATRPRVQKGIDSVAALIPIVSGYKLISDSSYNTGYTTRVQTKRMIDSLASISTGTGTVTSVATNTGSGITGGTITSTGTIAADTTILSTKANVTASLLGKVSSVSGTSPISSSGGATPTISISQATTSTNGYLSSTDWNTFNGKQNAFTQGISGYIPKWTSASGLDTSQIRQVGGSVFVGQRLNVNGATDNSSYSLNVNGTMSSLQGQDFKSDHVDNLFIGLNAGAANTRLSSTQGANNTFIGAAAGRFNTTGYARTDIGFGAGYNNTTGNGNANFGYQSGFSNISGNYNTNVGTDAGSRNKGNNNSFFGWHSGFGFSTFLTGDDNNIVGAESGINMLTAFGNNGFGKRVFYNLTNGYNNAAFGDLNSFTLTTGINNAAFGRDAMFSNSTGQDNAFVGNRSGYYATSSYNTAIGSTALFGLTTGESNTGIGYAAGSSITTGSYNTVIGSGVNIGNVSNHILIGNGTGAVKAKHDGSVWTLTDIVNTSSRLNVNGATDNSLFSLNNGGGTTYTNGFSPNASNYTGAITLGGGTTYVYTGSGAVTWTLPNPSGNNQIYIIKNQGTGAITLNAYSSNQLIPLSSTSGVSSVSIAVGETITIQQDGSSKSYVINQGLNLSSGTYSPTLTNVAGFGSGLTLNQATYQQIGNIVNVSMYITSTPTSGGSNSFTVTLPKARTSASTNDWVSGNSTSSQMSSGAGYVFANGSATLATIYIPIGSTTSTYINVTFSYTL